MRISDWSSDVCSSDLHGAFMLPERDGVDGKFVHPLYATHFNLPDLKTSIAGQVGKFLLRHGRQAHEPCETAHCSGQQQHDHPCEKLVQQIGRASCRNEWVSTCR